MGAEEGVVTWKGEVEDLRHLCGPKRLVLHHVYESEAPRKRPRERWTTQAGLELRPLGTRLGRSAWLCESEGRASGQ